MIQLNQHQVVAQLLSAYKNAQFANVINYLNVHSGLLKVDPVVIHVFAGSLRQLGEFQRAEKVLLQGLKKFKKHPDLLNSLGNLHLHLAKPDPAIDAFKKALQTEPSRLDIQYNLARALHQAGKYDAAIKQCRVLLAKQPSHTNAMLILAESYRDLGDRHSARKLLEEILVQEPANIRALNNLANLLRGEGEVSRAIAHFYTAINYQPDNPILLRNLAACQVLIAEKEAALETYKKAIQVNPYDWILQEELANFLWSENVDHPFAYIEKQLGAEACSLDFKLSYINLLLKAEEFTRALQISDEIEKELSTPSEKLLVLKARSYRELHRFSDSLRCSKAAIDLNGELKTGAFSEHGYALLSLGEPETALQFFEKLCRLEPKNQGWWTMISTCWAMLEEHQNYAWLCDYTNLVHCNKLLENPTESALFNDQLARILKDLHNNTKHPIGQSLQNGTQTYENLLESDLPIIQQLKERIIEEAKNFIEGCKMDSKHPFLARLSKSLSIKGSWSVNLHSEGFHKSHFHSEGWLSGVYYVDLPKEVEDSGQGWIVFGRADIPGQHFLGDLAIKPEPGSVVFFPSYMWHGTNPFRGKHRRLTVAFDIVPGAVN